MSAEMQMEQQQFQEMMPQEMEQQVGIEINFESKKTFDTCFSSNLHRFRRIAAVLSQLFFQNIFLPGDVRDHPGGRGSVSRRPGIFSNFGNFDMKFMKIDQKMRPNAPNS